MTGRRLIPLLVLAAATFGCDDQLAPPPSSTGGTTGTGNTAGMGSTGGTGGSSTGGAGGTAGAGGQTGGTGGAGNSAGSGGAGAGGTAGISGNGGSGGASGAGGAGGTGGAIIGACDNPTDNQAIGNLNPTSAREIAAGCGESASCQAETGQSFVDCVGSCVQSTAAGLSTACGSCYGEFALCLSAECLGECATDACDPLCETCMGYATCLEELNTCAGRPSTDCFDNT